VACWRKYGSRNARVNNALKGNHPFYVIWQFASHFALCPFSTKPSRFSFSYFLRSGLHAKPCILGHCAASIWPTHHRSYDYLRECPGKFIWKDSPFLCTVTLTAGSQPHRFLADAVFFAQCLCVSPVRAYWPLIRIRVSKLSLRDRSARPSSKKVLVAASRPVLRRPIQTGF